MRDIERQLTKRTGGAATARRVAVAFVISVCGTSPGQAVQAPDFERVTDAFRAELDRLRQAYGFRGATAAFVLADGRSFAAGTGFSDVERNMAMQPDAVFLAGSVGKTFVSAITMRLAFEGKLDLDDKVQRWLGEEIWYFGLPNGGTLTIRDLLRHTTGLTNYLEVYETWIPYWRDFLTRHPNIAPSPEALIGIALGQRPLFPSGLVHTYSDTNYLLLGLIIERASGTSYYDALTNLVLQPLDLVGEIVPQDRPDISGLATGYLKENNLWFLPTRTTTEKGVLLFNPEWEWTGGGVAATALGLAKWAALLYQGKAMPHEYLPTMLDRPLAMRGQPPKLGRYAAGVQVLSSPHGEAYGHMGSMPGYTSTMFYHPDLRVALSVLINEDEFREAFDVYEKLRDVLYQTLGDSAPGK